MMKSKKKGERVLLVFLMAATLLHEAMHAASHHVMGRRSEDFFEESRIREAGMEYIGHLFGRQPDIHMYAPLTATWITWECDGLFLGLQSHRKFRLCRESDDML